MNEPYLSIAGKRATDAMVYVPQTGAWVADVRLDSDDAVSGKVTLKIGVTSFVGTIDEAFSGAFNKRRALRVVGGAGWSKVIPGQHFHNDAGVKASQVLAAAASAAGETIDGAPSSTLGVDWARQEGAASAVLRRIAPNWFVRYDGTTSAGPRPSAAPGKYDLLNFDPKQNVAELAAEDVSAVQVGMTLNDSRFEKPLTVRQLEIRVENAGARLIAWGTT